MERMGKVNLDDDRDARIRNSGIVDDIQVYRSSIIRVANFAGHHIASSFQMRKQQKKESDDDSPTEHMERLIKHDELD